MIKLNCDLGELTGEQNNDALIMPYIDQANIACGFHASDPFTIYQTIALAKQHQVTIGAHPSYPDRANFGRTSMQLPEQELIAILHYQIGALKAMCQAQNTCLAYVKPHGALYNDMMANQQIFHTICHAIALLDNNLPLMIQAHPDNPEHTKIAQQYGVSLWLEAFADRAYQDNGLLTPRSIEGAVLSEPQQVLEQIKCLVNQQTIMSINQQVITIKADSICVHGDNLSAITLVKTIREWFNEQK
ncbi:5-oxoprolinase subunit PxpA [Thalassotalea sp. G2M2-11]|uniref:5-oxoprolinase subunit PxpA n=1 Tax=Thalassotalea sp. G2M2-11 TaxID=2787627 RepID=UPI001F49AE48|nr:5-oxoprolinase subunit PxpA [Thalassotalea sp. G2M2-11]